MIGGAHDRNRCLFYSVSVITACLSAAESSEADIVGVGLQSDLILLRRRIGQLPVLLSVGSA